LNELKLNSLGKWTCETGEEASCSTPHYPPPPPHPTGGLIRETKKKKTEKTQDKGLKGGSNYNVTPGAFHSTICKSHPPHGSRGPPDPHQRPLNLHIRTFKSRNFYCIQRVFFFLHCFWETKEERFPHLSLTCGR